MSKTIIYCINMTLITLFFVLASQININVETQGESRSIRPLQMVNSTYQEVDVNYIIKKEVIPPKDNTDWESRVRYHCSIRNLNCDTVLRIMYCESGGRSNAFNPSSGASGLFQQLQIYWDARAKQYGVAGTSPFDGEANIIVSLGMMEKGMMSHWECK